MGNSLIRANLEVHLPHSLHRSATVNTPANRLHAHSLGRYQQAEKKKKKDTVLDENIKKLIELRS